jgi:hypothetical protein
MEKEQRLESIKSHHKNLLHMQMQQKELEMVRAELEASFNVLNEQLERVCSEITLIVASEDGRGSADVEDKRRDLEAVAEYLKAAKVQAEAEIGSLKARLMEQENDIKLEEEQIAKLS